MKIWKMPVAATLAMTFLAGCGSGHTPDSEMTTSPAGLWVGQTNPDESLDIQGGGYIKITRNGQETVGNWTQAAKDSIQVTMNGQSYTMPFERKDLSLKITLPGESAPSQFGQM